jgi:glyoxylate reductase
MDSTKRHKVLMTRPLPENEFISAQLKDFCASFEVVMGLTQTHMPRDEILSLVEDVDALICHGRDHPDAELIARASKLKVISVFGAGFDTVDVAAATERNVWVCNTAGAVTAATADIALYLLLAACRRTTEAEGFLRQGTWEKKSSDILSFWGNNPEGKTLGIIGMGNIGQALAKRATALGMRIVYHNRHPLVAEKENGATYCANLDDLLGESDFISIHTPLTDKTKHLLGRDQFAKMKKKPYIINTARGAVIDEEALVNALKWNIVRGAGLDVFEQEPKVHQELLSFASVTLLPHIGTATIETRSSMFLSQLENVRAVLEGRRPATPVNEVQQLSHSAT